MGPDSFGYHAETMAGFVGQIREVAAAGVQVGIVVGGGNSAGQGAMFLSRYARSVTIVIRASGLDATMSRYLIEQIEKTANISVRPGTVVKMEFPVRVPSTESAQPMTRRTRLTPGR